VERKYWFPLLILSTMCFTYFITEFFITATSALTPVLIVELGINKGTMGLVISALFLIYGLMQIPAGIFTDIIGPRKTILSFTALTTVGVFLFWVSHRLELLFAAQFIIGVGCSVFYINAVSIISKWFKANRRATAIGVLGAASNIGIFASYMGFPLADKTFGGWRNLYFLVAVILVVNYAMNFLILRNDPNETGMVHEPSKKLLGSLRDVLKDRRIYPFLIGYVMLILGMVFNTWMPQILIDTKGFSYIDAGVIASVGSIAGIPGCIAMGIISDRLRKRKLPLVLFSTLYVVALVSFILAPPGTPLALFLILSFSLSFCVSIWVLFFSIIPEILSLEKVSIGLGLVNGMGIIAMSIFTPIYGILIDVTGGYSFSNLVLIIVALMMTGILVLFASETYGGVKRE
jgi:predicted MFS family arabinose efflux permease